jgi:5'-3' exonuclease
MTLVLDGNELFMKAVFVWRKNRKISLSYFFLLQLFKYIKLIKADKIYIVADGGSSWRKGIYPEYKANRKERRDAHTDINWDTVFAEYTQILQNIQAFTPMHTIRIHNIEGDDIISYLCRYSGDEVTVVSQDRDIQQLLILPGIKIYSPRKQDFITPSAKTALIADTKMRQGDVSDNIPKANSLKDLIRNQILIDLINLPTAVDSTIRNRVTTLKKDKRNYSLFLQKYPYKFLKKVYNILVGSIKP